MAFLRLSLSALSTHSPAFPHLSMSRCFGEDTCITIPDIDAVVMVLQPSEPRITITGVERLNRPASDLRAPGGIALFQDLHIISTVTRADATAHHTGMDYHTVGTPFATLGAQNAVGGKPVRDQYLIVALATCSSWCKFLVSFHLHHGAFISDNTCVNAQSVDVDAQ